MGESSKLDDLDTPTVYVIAGPNGAGKTTYAAEFLPSFVECREFLNADLIAAGLSPFAPETQNVRAGRLLLERIGELAAERSNFSFETTLAGRTYVKLLEDMKKSGYRVVLFFLWLPDAEMAINRVAHRVSQGGHNIPQEDVRRRYNAGIRNLFELYQPIVDSWWLYDASFPPPEVIANQDEGRLSVENDRIYRRVKRQAECLDE